MMKAWWNIFLVFKGYFNKAGIYYNIIYIKVIYYWFYRYKFFLLNLFQMQWILCDFNFLEF